MEPIEAVSAAKAIYFQSASLAGLDVSNSSPDYLGKIVYDGFERVTAERKPEAVANVLKLIAATLEAAQEANDSMLHEASVEKGSSKICPIYPFD